MNPEIQDIIDDFKAEFGESTFNFDLTAMKIFTAMSQSVRDLELQVDSLASQIQALRVKNEAWEE
jgi:hypothetical protein